MPILHEALPSPEDKQPQQPETPTDIHKGAAYISVTGVHRAIQDQGTANKGSAPK